MKKYFALLIFFVGFLSSSFALHFTVGGNFNIGGTTSQNQDYNGFSIGGGALFNLDLFLGLGFQVEINATNSKVAAVDDNTISFSDISIVDVPVMLWWNGKFGPFGLGAGAGLNFSTIESFNNLDNYNVDHVSIGFACGANTIFYIIGDFLGIMLGVNAVFDFTPRITVTEEYKETTVHVAPKDWTRQSIYGKVGVVCRF